VKTSPPIHPHERAALGALTVLLILLASGLGRSCGSAEADEPRRDPPAVVLARFLCGEADAHAPDYAPLLHTMARRAGEARIPLVSLVLRYSAPLRGYGGARGRWVRALPDELPRPAYAATWSAALDAAETFLAGDLPDPCDHPARHFGSPDDVLRRWPTGRRADCGDTRNVFLY
jgi:hypothetical protein